MIISIGDPAVAAVPLRENDEPLVDLAWISGSATGTSRLVRAGVAQRLADAQRSLPEGVRLHLVQGWRPVREQRRIIARYAAGLRAAHPHLDDAELARLVSRYVAPVDVAPHVAGAAVDVTLASDGRELWMGCSLDATPEESAGACYTDAPGLDPQARAHRRLLADALGGAGLVNYPTEWWHWSHGDRYWAHATGAEHAVYGPRAGFSPSAPVAAATERVLA